MRATKLAALSVVSLLLPVPLLSAAVNEEAALRLEAMTRAETAAVQNMTVETSLHILQNIKSLHPDDISFIQETLSSQHRHHHHKRFGHHLRHHSHKEVKKAVQISGAISAGVPSGYAEVKKAVAEVSKSIKEANSKWELENNRCCEEHSGSTNTLEGLAEDIAQANSQASTSQGEILKANKKISENENKIPAEEDSMRSIKQQCAMDKQSLEKDLTITNENLVGMDNMEMTNCDKKAALLQCEGPGGESFLMLHHHTTRTSARQWQTPAGQRFLKDLSSSSEKHVERPTVFLQTEEHTDPQKCTMQANPECQQIRDRYLLMTSDLEDSLDELQEKLKSNENGCETNVNSIEENVKNADAQLKQVQTALAEATADYNQAMEASRLKNEERTSHLATMKEQAKKCAENKNEAITEKTGLLKIRGEMLAMNSLVVSIQDCKVSDWIPGECSKPCGGGMRRMTRDVIVPQVLDGAACPLLLAEEPCNMQKCPVNCEMGEWGGWSACSAKCGGGVYERVRDIKRHGAHGGKPCEAAEETQSCNPQSCDKNCMLHRWSPWSACSRACGGGTTFKVRTVKDAEEGQGTCPKPFGRLRYKSKECHKHPCLDAKTEKDKTLKCKSKRDLILVIDGSASLRNSGWDATKKAAAGIVKAMGDDVNVATLLFSGPKTRKNYFKCSGQRWPN